MALTFRNSDGLNEDIVSRETGLPVQGVVGIDQSNSGYSNATASVSDYPSFAVPVAANSGNAAAAIATATIAANPNKITYLTGVQISASGATSGLAVAPTITGLLGGTMTLAFVFPAGVLVSAQPLTIAFCPPIPAVGKNTAVVATLPSSGSGGTNAVINIQGYQL